MLDLAPVPVPRHEPQAGGATGARAIHRVRFATFAHRRVFADTAIAARAAHRLRALPRCPQSHVLAWVLLPDGWLGVIETAASGALARHVDRLKDALAADASRGARSEPLWATAFHARFVHDDVALAQAAREILDEPVRAGLASHRGEYPFWWTLWLVQDAIPALPRRPDPVAVPAAIRT